MVKSYKYILLSLFIFGINYGQTLKRSDFKIGLFDLSEPINSITKFYGEPINEELIDGDIVYYYPSFTIWVDEMYDKINAFQIIHSKLALPRGITIGDSLQKVIQLFGKPDQSGEKFERFVGGYDFKFNDYSIYLDYSYKTDKYDSHFSEYYYWHIIFYIKEDHLARILYFEEIFE